MSFVRNSWYVAGWSGELARDLKPLTIMGEDIVVYRTEAGTAVIDFGSTDAAVKISEDQRNRGVRLFALHFLTPVDETTTVDHWMHLRNIALDDPEIGDRMNEQFRVAFVEDKAILEAIQRRETKPRARRPVRLAIDRGANLLRRTIKEMQDEEIADVGQLRKASAVPG